MKRLAKLAWALVASCALAAALVGCMQPTPSSVTTDAMNAVKAGGLSAIASFCDGDVGLGDSTSALATLGSESGLTDEQKAITETYASKMLSYDFKVSDEQVSGDSATVTVTYEAYDCATPFMEALSAYLEKAFALALANAFSGNAQSTDVSEYVAYFYDELKTQVDSMGDKSQEYVGTVTLGKEDGAWKITAVDDGVRNGVTGGLYGYVASVSDSLSKLSGSSEGTAEA